MESRFAQPLEQVPLRFRRQLALVAHGVHERGQVTVRRDLRVLLAKTACGGVARIGERLLAVGLGSGVERLEAGFGHVAFAAQLDGGIGVADAGQGAVVQAQRHVLHRAHVHRDVLARGAIAARGRADKAASLVRERHRRAVDLQLAHQLRDGAEELLDARQPLVKRLGAHGVVERIHAALVLDGRELLAHVAAHALRGAGRIDELGMRRLKRAQLVHQRVERGVADGGRVLGVVQVAVVLDLAAQRLDARRRIARRLGERPLVQEVLLFVCHVLHRRLDFLHREEGPERIRGLRHFIEILPRVAAGSAPAPWFHQRLRQRPRPGYASMALFAFQP